MKMKTFRVLFLLILVLKMVPLASAQWTPVVAKQKRIIYKIQPDGTKLVTSEYTGTFFRSSDGSTLGTWVPLVNGQEEGKGKSTLIDAKTGKDCMIFHDNRMVRCSDPVPLPRLPLYNASSVIPEERIKGREIIHGIEAVGFGVRVDDKPVPGVTWQSLAHDLKLKQYVEWSPTSSQYMELYAIEFKEPKASLFQVPVGYLVGPPMP